MRRSIVSWFGICVAAWEACAQLSIQVKPEKETFLVYESIPMAVLIHNYSGRTIELTGEMGRPWLSFVVTDESGSIMPALGKPTSDEPLLIAPGKTVKRTVDLLPLYDIRTRGSYRVQAKVESVGMRAMSPPATLTVIHGREIWSETVGLPPKDRGVDEYRTYALLARRSEERDILHVSVRDDQHQVVYGVLALGGFIALGKPDARIDQRGHLHLLYQIGPRSYGYVHIDPYAQVVDRAVYSDMLSNPKLTVASGEISVQGGEKTYPKPERVMSDEELNPPSTNAPPKRKRHWWWPFGGSATTPAVK